MPKPLFLPLVLAVAAGVLAVHAACTAERSTAYADGAPIRRAPVRMAPTYTPPGTGLPEYWGPPEAKPDVQPQPRPKRYLPPEPDGKPGIWASDAPPSEEPLLLGSVLPIDPGPFHERRLEIPRRCARLMQRAVDLWGYEHKLTEPRLRRCLAAELFRLCVNHYSDKDHPEYGAVQHAMQAFYNRACVGMEHSEELDNRFTGIQAEVDRALKEIGP